MKSKAVLVRRNSFYNCLFHWLILRYERLHANPSEQVSHGAVAEYDEVASRFALEAKECEPGTVGILKQTSCHLLEDERAESGGHTADSRDSSRCVLGEDVGTKRIHICRPRLMCGTTEAYTDYGEPW